MDSAAAYSASSSSLPSTPSSPTPHTPQHTPASFPHPPESLISVLAHANSSKSTTTSPSSHGTLSSPERSFLSKGSLDSHEKNRTPLRPHLRRHPLGPYGRLAS